MCRTMFSSITMASSTTKPDRRASAPSATGCRGCSRTAYITANVPTTDTGSARLGMTVAETFRRNRKMTSTTRPMVSTSVNFTSATDSRIDFERSLRTPSVTDGRQLRLQLRQQRANASRRPATVFAPGWRWIETKTVARAVWIGAGLVVLDAVEHVGQLVEPHRRAVAVGDDDRLVGRGRHQLAVGLDDERLVRAGQRAGRRGSTLACWTACATWSMPICRDASSRGSTSMRTANFCAP